MTPRDQANYIFYKIVMEFWPYFTYPSSSSSVPRWKTCVGQFQLEDSLNIALNAMYVKAFLTPAVKTAAEDIVKNLMANFKKMLIEEDWMDPKTRAEAEKKMDKMIANVAYPKELLDDELITQYYSDLKMKKNDSFLLKYISLANFMKRKKAAKLRLY